MQVNEHAGQVRQGRRLPDRAFKDTRSQPEARSKRLGTEEPRQPAQRAPARSRVSYGAGF